MRKIISILLVLSLCTTVFSQDSINLARKMRIAVRNNEIPLAKQIYAVALEEDYYDMESLERVMCLVNYLEKDYDNAKQKAQKLFDDGENSLLTDIIQMICWSKSKENDNLLGERIAESLAEPDIPKTILLDLNLFAKDDFKKLNSAIQRYISKNELTEKQELKPFKTIQTLLYFCQENYLQCYNSGIDLITEDNPNVIYYILGFVREKRHEYNSAIAFYNLAIKGGFNNYDAYLHRAICQGSEANYVASNKDLDTCLAIDSNYYALYLKGINHNYLKDYNTALYYLNLSLQLCDTFSDTYNYRGIVYANLKEYQFSELDFRIALQKNPNTPFAHNNLGISLEKIGKIDEAMKEYQTSIKLEPRFFDAYYNLGRIYTNRKEYKKAIKHLEKALYLEQEVSDIYYLLGLNYAFTKKKETACEYLHKALDMGHTEAQGKISSYCEEQTQQPLYPAPLPNSNTEAEPTDEE